MTTTEGRPPNRLGGVRAAAALTLYAMALAVIALCGITSIAGGGFVEFGPLRARITSWKILRWIGLCLFVAHLIDPRRTATRDAVRRFVLPRQRLLAGIGLSLVALHLVLFKISQYRTFEIGAPDFTMVRDALHNTLRGRFLYSFALGRSYLSEHASPILLLALPFYAIFPSPLTLLALQGLVAAAAVVPLYLIAREFRLPALASFLVTAVFLSNEFFWTAFVYDVHVEVAAPLCVFLAALAALKRRWGLYYPALLLLLSVKEEMAIVAVSLALFVGISVEGARRHAGFTALIALAWAYLAWVVVIPASYPEARATSHFITRWSHLGDDYWGILTGLARRPGYVASLFTGKPVRDLLLSLGFLPLLDPLVALLAAPPLLLHLSTNYAPERTLGLYYALPAATLLFLALCRGLARLSRLAGARAAVCAALVVVLVYPGVKWCRRVTERDRLGEEMLQSVPAGTRVSAQSTIVPHLPPSEGLTMFPERDGAEWILLDLSKRPWPLEPQAYAREVQGLLDGDEYGVETFKDEFLFLRRGAATGRNGEPLAAVIAAGARPVRR